MNHVQQIQKLWKMFLFVQGASAEELVQFGFYEVHREYHVYKLDCWLPGDKSTEPSFTINSTRIHGVVKIVVENDSISYQLAGVGSYAIRQPRNVETNMVRVLDEDTVTIRASNTGNYTWLSDVYGSNGAKMVDKLDEADMFQTSLIVNVPMEYVQIQNEMIDLMRIEARKNNCEFDKIILTYSYPIVDLQIPDVPEKL